MGAGVFTFDVIATLALSATLLYNYGNWMRHRILVTVAVLIAWYFSFLIIFVIPLDVSSTAFRQCVNSTKVITFKANETRVDHLVAAVDATSHARRLCQEPYSLLDPDVLPNLWRIVYWSSQILTWLILPVMQSFSQAGEFTVGGKLKSSLRDNVIFYSSYLLIALILVIYIAIQPDLHLTWDRTKAIAASAANTWGLFVLVLMLGYGLVEVPRNLWYRSQRGYQLQHAYFKVSKLMAEKSDAEESLEDIVLSVHLVSEEMDHCNHRRKFVEEILRKIPTEVLEKVKRRRGDVSGLGAEAMSEKYLVKLHRQVIHAVQAWNRTEAQWSDWADHVFSLEDVNKNMVSNDHRFVHSTNRPPRNIVLRNLLNPVVEWYWKCLLQPILLRLAAGAAALTSILIIWSEVTFFSIKPTLSVFASIVSLAAADKNYFLMELTCLFTIFYMCLCTYYTVFKIRVLNYYYLASNHHSDEYTLLFSGALLCRLTPPLCLNFLSLIHMDSHVIDSQIMETAYTQIMGHVDVVSIISDYFNIYFPIALLVLTAATYFSLGARLLSSLGFQQFLTQDSELTMELVEEGKEHAKREKRRRQRLAESASRRRDFNNRFGDSESRASSSEIRQRAADIVKSQSYQRAASPERSLLSEQPSPARNINPSGDHVEVDLSFPIGSSRSPPRNIFDDI